MRLDRVSFLWLLASQLGSSALVRADDLILAGPVERVVASGNRVAVVRGGEVRVIDGDGRTLWHLRDDARLPAPSARFDRRAEDVLDDRDIVEEDRDTTEAEDLVDDDLTGRERRSAAPPAAPRDRPTLLAADQDGLWVAARGLLFRIDHAAHVSTTAPALPLAQLAAADGAIVTADGGRLFSSYDGGATFTALAQAAGRISALAADVGRVAFASGRRLVVHAAGAVERSLTLASPVLELSACGRALAALTTDGAVLAIDENATAVRGHVAARPTRIACDGDLWVAAAPGLAVSRDGGRTWRARLDAPPEPIHDVAVGGSCVWLATAAGLRCLPREGSTRHRAAVIVEAIHSRPPPWHALLPRLVLTGMVDTRPGKQDVRAIAYADFPLDRAPRPRAVPAGFRLAAEEQAPPAAAGAAPDPEAPCLAEIRARGVALAMAEPRAARSLVERARRAAWLPDLRLRVVRRLGRTESLSLRDESAVQAPLGLGTVDDVRYEARASWDLSRLVFSIDEVAARSEAQRMADMRREIESSANRLYFERRRLKIDLLHVQGPEPGASAQKELRVEELEAELDALSGGAFGRCIGRAMEAPP